MLLLVVAGGAGASVNAASGRAVMGWFGRRSADSRSGSGRRRFRSAGRRPRWRSHPSLRPVGRRPVFSCLPRRAWRPRSAGAIGLREAPPAGMRTRARGLRPPAAATVACGAWPPGSGLIVARPDQHHGVHRALPARGARALDGGRGRGVRGDAVAGAALEDRRRAHWSDRVGMRIRPLLEAASGSHSRWRSARR